MHILKFLTRLGPLSPALHDRLDIILKQGTIKKGVYLLKAGQVCDKVWWLSEGLIRTYIPSYELTTWFYLPDTVLYHPLSVNTRVVSKESMVALEDCEVVYIERSNLCNLYKDFPFLSQLERMVYDQYVANLKEHNIIKSVSYLHRIGWFQAKFETLLFNSDCVDYVASFLNLKRTVYLKTKKECFRRNSVSNPLIF